VVKKAKAPKRKPVVPTKQKATTGRTRANSGTNLAGAKNERAATTAGKARTAKKATVGGAAKPAPAESSVTGRAGAPRQQRPSVPGRGKVSVRMYRGLLGDFFLVKHTAGERVFKMLIDCGVLQCIGSKENKPVTSLGKERIVAGVADLMRDTGGALDLVVATHEHYDHLSGFILANEAFKPLRIAKVWMAWTESRQDKLANGYRDKKNKALAALSALTQAPAFAAASEMKTVRNLLQFYGGIDRIQSGAMGAARRASGDGLAGNASCEAVLEWLRRKAGIDNVAFAKPGEVLHWGLDDAFRAYVLGPPRDDKKLRKLNPSEGAEREVYLALGEDVETMSGLAAIHGDRAGEAGLADQPFAALHWRPYGTHKKSKSKRAGKLSDPVVTIYEETGDKHRRIDGEWLGSAENLALKIDSDVNNTSLALALELTDRKVLLFPGDAQVGNWLSWSDQTYPADDATDGLKMRIDDLLARTVFYKVGHHASHNATLRERGLELMIDPRLCAMIPVVENTAREQKTEKSPKGWAMPYGDLYTRLAERTGGRTLRGDGDIDEETSKFRKSIFSLAYGANFKPKDPLWVELALEL
jgi:hypothetical protein